MSESPDDIVGHKTFDTGERCPETGFPLLRHEPLTRAEGEALWQRAEQQQKDRAARMPDEKSAISTLFDAWQRLKEFGWNDPSYCPKDGTRFNIIQLGSTGIFEGAYRGAWPNGSWDSWDERDSYCSSIAPAMFKLFPEDQARKDAFMKAAAERFKIMMSEENSSLLPSKDSP